MIHLPAGTWQQPAPVAPVRDETTGLLPVTTLVFWVGCLLVGIFGYTLASPRLLPAVPPTSPVTLEKIVVSLADQQSPSPAVVAPPDPLTPPPPAPAVAVAEPCPALAMPLAFTSLALATDGGRISSLNRPAISSSTQAPAAYSLVFGHGEGRQPMPEYPSTSVIRGQEGVVNVRFSVGADGQVSAVCVAATSPWPLLDQAAMRAVRERWHFAPGIIRTYEVAISFRLEK